MRQDAFRGTAVRSSWNERLISFSFSSDYLSPTRPGSEARSERWGWITSRRGQDGLSKTAVISGWASTACGISRGTLTTT